MGYTFEDEIKLKRQANNLEALARKYDGIIADINSSSSKLNDWDSAAGEKWRSEVNKLIHDASVTAQELRNAAARIRAYTDSHKYLLEDEIGNTVEKVIEFIDKATGQYK